MERLNILFSTNSLDTIDNGPAFFADLLRRELLPRKSPDFRIISEDIKTEETIPNIYRLKLRKTIWNTFFYQFFRTYLYHKEAMALRKEFPFDVLVYNNAFTGLLSTFLINKKVVVMVNDYNRSLHLKSKFAFTKSYFKNLILFHFEKYAVRSATTTIVNSQYLKDVVVQMYKVKPDKVQILYKGIPTKAYTSRIRETIGAPVKILFVKGGYDNGGFFDLIKALQQLSASYDFHLTIAGPQPIAHQTIIDALERHNISYTLYGPILPVEVKKLMNEADIFCVPSHREALGVANMEALASGLPVISTDVGGIPEVLDQGKAGWLVPPQNPDELAKAIVQCIEDRTLRIQKSNHGLQYVTRFNSEDLINNFLSILAQASPN